MRKLLAILLLFALISSCKSDPSKPQELIDEQTYERMFVEFAIINQLDQKLLENTSEEELRNKVFEHYGVSEEEFEISHQYYEQQLEQQLDRVSEITKMLRSERDTLNTIERKYQQALKEDKSR